MNALIELHYFPPIAYFSALQSVERIIIEKHEHFIKQTYRNRCHILTAQGVEKLVVPLTSKHGKVLISDVRIDYAQKWVNNHWRTIESAYRSAPFFEFYADDVQKVLFKQHTFLYDMNLDLLTICLKWLKLNVTVQESMSYEKTPHLDIIDLRNVIHAKKPELYANNFKPVPYTQVFGNKFVAELSLIDLVFCEGPNARNVLAASAKPL